MFDDDLNSSAIQNTDIDPFSITEGILNSDSSDEDPECIIF